jgi:hypothetical protein
MEVSIFELVEIKAKLTAIEAMLYRMSEAMQLDNLSSITEAKLRKQNPGLSIRFLKKVREEKGIGKKLGRDIVYNQRELQTIYEIVQLKSKINFPPEQEQHENRKDTNSK